MTTITIDKGVPIPTERQWSSPFPFGKMEVGDSFTVPHAQKQLARAHANQYQNRHRASGWTYKSRSIPTGLRVWRVA